MPGPYLDELLGLLDIVGTFRVNSTNVLASELTIFGPVSRKAFI